MRGGYMDDLQIEVNEAAQDGYVVTQFTGAGSHAVAILMERETVDPTVDRHETFPSLTEVQEARRNTLLESISRLERELPSGY